jgi:hypothetical protein
MGKWVSRGYCSTDDAEARGVELEFFRKNLSIILANSYQVLATPRYFFCQLGSAWLSVAFWFGGGGKIPLGVLVALWQTGDMVFECPGCHGRLYAVGICGSVLSGCGSAWGTCANCRQSDIRSPEVATSILAVGNMLQIHRNEPVIERGKQPRFDWTEGLVGESTPDRVVVPTVEAVDLHTLVEELTGTSRASDRAIQPTSAEDARSTALSPSDRPRGFTSPLRIERQSRRLVPDRRIRP